MANLELVAAEDVLESGIEITAQPPGTKLKSITLLSGGQKTLTAVALLFALYMVKPSPFCLLDELDAPLDESNIGRFTDLLKIDAHSHIFEDAPEIHALLRELNVRTINVCNNGTDGHLERMHALAYELAAKHPDLYPFESTFDLTRRDAPGYTAAVTAWLDDTFRRAPWE